MKSAALVEREGCGGASFPFHAWRKGDGTAGVVDVPVVRMREAGPPFVVGMDAVDDFPFERVIDASTER